METEEDLFEFKPIPGYEGLYSVNQSNQVVSYKYGKTRLLKGGKHGKDYYKVQLCDKNKRKKIWNVGIHILVALALDLPKEPHHNVVKHLDNIASHNYASNLKWDTQSQNMIDAAIDGLKIYKIGKEHHNFKHGKNCSNL